MVEYNNKTKWRKLLRLRRISLSKQERNEKSLGVSQQLMTYISNHLKINVVNKTVLGGYVSVGSECNINDFYQSWKGILCYPCIELENYRLIFRKPDQDFKINNNSQMNIPQPDINCAEHKPDIIIVPLLGYTTKGYRLGQGQGWYDKTLSYYKKNYPCNELPLSIGVGFECQKEDEIPIEDHDQKCDVIINEEKIYIINRNNT